MLEKLLSPNEYQRVKQMLDFDKESGPFKQFEELLTDIIDETGETMEQPKHPGINIAKFFHDLVINTYNKLNDERDELLQELKSDLDSLSLRDLQQAKKQLDKIN